MSNEEKVSNVIESQAMVAPTREKVLRRMPDPTLPQPPAVHARIHAGDSEDKYVLQYNGVDLITLDFLGEMRPNLRFHSDGDFQSEPFVQQFVAFAGSETSLRMRICSPEEFWNVRPERAAHGQAILYELGAPLLYNVNGIYIPQWDLLISLHGAEIRWEEDSVREEGGLHTANASLTLNNRPLVILFRPRYFNEHMGYRFHRPWERRPKPEPICGWCSWEAFHDRTTLEDVRETSAALVPLRPYGLTIMQLDDGYQQFKVPLYPNADVGESWLRPNEEKFPGGHPAILSTMTSGGWRPGIWLNATLTDHDNAASLNCCLKDEDGNLIQGDWIQYIMDCEPDTLERHVTKCFRDLKALGYSYFKVDSIRHLLYDGLQEAVRRGLMTTEEARDRHRAYLCAARKGIGEDAYMLSCWGVLSSAIGVCDAMRIATDANPSWQAFSMQLRETARWGFAQRILFTVDPDHVCVRAPIKWVRTLLSNVSLTGGLMMVSDPPGSYDEARLDLMRHTMPPLASHAAELGPIDYTTPACCAGLNDWSDEENSVFISSGTPEDPFPFASLSAVHLAQGGRVWCVAQRIAVTPLPEVELPLESLTLDPAEVYYAYDFWERKAWKVTGSIHLCTLPLGDTQVISLTRLKGSTPALIGSTRHVSCDAVSVENVCADEKELMLDLKGFKGLCVQYTLYAPNLAGVAEAEGAETQLARKDDLLVLDVIFHADKARVVVR